jgi:DNA-binding LacI/PurR family transcriptional regulator
MKNYPTMRDVAEATGVSINTVSRALNLTFDSSRHIFASMKQQMP